jgi:hypothetical protein
VTQTAASTSQMGRFETEVLTQEANLFALTESVCAGSTAFTLIAP